MRELPVVELRSFLSTDPTITAKLVLASLQRFSSRMRQLASALARHRDESGARS